MLKVSSFFFLLLLLLLLLLFSFFFLKKLSFSFSGSDYGDVHYYNYDADCWDLHKYPRPRFASEYGFQSMSSMPTFQSVLLESDLAYRSEAVMHRQHHRSGQDQVLFQNFHFFSHKQKQKQKQMMNQFKLHFHEPTNPNPKRLFDDMCFATQVMQALCMKIETEHYRRIRSEKGHTMGTLYWQLNDVCLFFLHHQHHKNKK